MMVRRSTPPRRPASCIGSKVWAWLALVMVSPIAVMPRLGPQGRRSVPIVQCGCGKRPRHHIGLQARNHEPAESGYMLLSALSCRISAEINTAFSLPVFFHQWAVVWVSGATSPALCTIGTAQVLAYSVTSPD